jgi:cytoskeletal protein CcmA (bactofilin family)/predicted anti-sigma-YlaC factor YlaD
VICLTEFQCAQYADGELPAREAHNAAEHLETCAACRELVGVLRTESRVLIESLQTTDFIEFELEDETLSAPQARSLSVARFAAFILAISVLLRPVLASLDVLGIPELLSWLPVTATIIVPVLVRVIDSVLNNAAWIALSTILVLAVFVFSRRAAVTSTILSILALLTVFSSSSYGMDVRRSDKPLTVPAGETVDDTLVVAAESVTIDGTVTGDLIAFAGQVTIRGRVKGNVVSFARRVELEGVVEGSVMGFAQSVETRGQVAHNIYAFGQTVDLRRDARIDENATLFAAQSNVEGTIGKDANVFAGSMNVSAPAHIGGGLTAKVSRTQNAYIAPGVTIGGKTDIQAPQPAPSKYSRLSFYVWQTIWLAAAFIAGLVLFWLVPSLSRARFDNAKDLLVSAGLGCIALIAAPVAAIVAMITLVGLPLGLIGLSAWILGIYLAKIIVAGFLGRSLLTNIGDAQPAIPLVLLAGLVPVFIAINLPFIGGLINFLLIVLGLGTVALRLSELPRWSAPQAA